MTLEEYADKCDNLINILREENLTLKKQNKELQEENWKLEEQITKWKEDYICLENLKDNHIKELEAQIEKMRDCLNRWYIQKSDKFTDSFYEQLIKDTEECLWSDAK